MTKQVKCTVVMYHYVRNMNETIFPDIKGLLVRKFIGQINYILSNYRVIKLEDYIEFLKGKKDVPENSCILTFDDGFKDHYVNVFPLLKDKNIPASFFPMTQPLSDYIVPSVHKAHFILAKVGARDFANAFNEILKKKFPELVGEYFIDDGVKKEPKYRWDDNLTANLKYNIARIDTKPKVEIINEVFSRYFKNEKEFCLELYMNWEDMKEMIKGGMSIGNHTYTHPALASLTEKEQATELRVSKELLEKKLGIKSELFSFPYGVYNETSIKLLRENGYIGGITTDHGINEGSDIDPFLIKRLDTNDLPFE